MNVYFVANIFITELDDGYKSLHPWKGNEYLNIFPDLCMMWLLSGASVSENGLSFDGFLEHVESILKHDSIENIKARELAMNELGYAT